MSTLGAHLDTLRTAILAKLPDGAIGHRAAYIEFRRRAGHVRPDAGAGGPRLSRNRRSIPFSEFLVGIAFYGVSWPDATCRKAFAQLDANGDGMIDSGEFLQWIRGGVRTWCSTPMSNTPSPDMGLCSMSAKHAYDASRGGRWGGSAQEVPLSTRDMIDTLRRRIVTSLPRAAASVARCWMSFRNRCGCDQQVQGLTKEQFVRGMRVMGFTYEDDATYDRVFDSLQLDAHGRLQMESLRSTSSAGARASRRRCTRAAAPETANAASEEAARDAVLHGTVEDQDAERGRRAHAPRPPPGGARRPRARAPPPRFSRPRIRPPVRVRTRRVWSRHESTHRPSRSGLQSNETMGCVEMTRELSSSAEPATPMG